MFISYLNTSTLKESSATGVGLVIGKFSPVTKGHKQMVDRLIRECAARKLTPMVCIVDVGRFAPDRLLTGKERLDQIKDLYGDLEIVIVKNAFDALLQVSDSNRRCGLIVCGSDRLSAYKSMAARVFADTQTDPVEVVALARDPDSDGTEGLSSSKARAAVVAGDFNQFKQVVPSSEPKAQKLFDLLKRRYDSQQNVTA
jgi:citrate lyase synthetase